MKNTFTTKINKLIKEYNKTKPSVLLDEVTEASTTKFFEDINKWSMYVSTHYDLNFHLTLNHLINNIYKIIFVDKYKPKYLKEVNEDIVYLSAKFTKEALDQIVIDFEQQPLASIYKTKEGAKLCLSKYLDMFMSKLVDYVPNDKNTINKLEPTIEMLGNFSKMMNYFIDQGYHTWVYSFTETTRFIPLQFKYLDVYDSLGKRIDKWTEEFNETEVCRYLNEKGYNVFGGWGNLHYEQQEEKKEEPVVKSSNGTEPKDLPKITLSLSNYRNMVADCATCCAMFTHNPMFIYTNQVHRHFFVRMMAMCIFHYTENHYYNETQINRAIADTKALLTKNGTRFVARRDRKYWFDNNLGKDIREMLDIYQTERSHYFATSIALFTYDKITGDEFTDALKDSHHKFLAVTYNKIFYSKKPLSNEELTSVINHYHTFLKPRIELISVEERRYMYSKALNFTLDIVSQDEVDDVYFRLANWFKTRHSKEENENFFKEIYTDVLFMSYNNKGTMVNKLETETIDIVSYGGSKEIYQRIVDVLYKDINTPILDRRVENIQINEEGKLEKVSP